MLLKSAIISCCVLWACTNGENVIQGEKIFPEPSGVTNGPIIPTTTIIPPTNSTTLKPNTTTLAPTTTTTLAPKPNTTTAATTTTTSTTAKPTSPTPKPDNKPVINDFIGNYSGTKNICLMVKMAVVVEVLVKDKNSTMINVPKAPKFNAVCPQNTEESLTINWENNSIIFGFSKNNSKFEIRSINVSLSGTNKTFYHLKPEFSVSEKLSYYCAKDQALNLTDGTTSNVTLARLHLSHMQYQAFVNQTEAHYATVWDCDGINTPDIVPIVVGCVLAVLVVLVLVAYLFGRRSCQARGYLSM
ncbi:unnamed protein product [Ceutorhynchus assimilis]|uniref:Lysosome-associated membrane glycoprotein 5 n=1 Tax=Ceutorhynchus assimilis TaxID=467358 RepID=A0A9N9MTB9_9CUCU|nr:unnamed protein product [Ceutorhynchus assimilis]